MSFKGICVFVSICEVATPCSLVENGKGLLSCIFYRHWK